MHRTIRILWTLPLLLALSCGDSPRRHGLTESQWVSLLAAPDEPIAWAALRAVGEMDKAPPDVDAALKPLLVHPSARIVSGAADLLAREGRLTAFVLFDASRRAPTPEGKALLATHLAGLGEKGHEAILDFLAGGSEEREFALAGLAALPPAEVTPVLVKAAASLDPGVRRDAFQGFIRLGRTARMPPEVVMAGLGDPVADVRFAAVWAAGACGVTDPQVMDALRISTTDGQVLPAALRAFLLLGRDARAAAPEVRGLMRHPEPLIRRQAVEAIVAIAPGDPATRRALETAAREDSDRLVRETARRALGG